MHIIILYHITNLFSGKCCVIHGLLGCCIILWRSSNTTNGLFETQEARFVRHGLQAQTGAQTQPILFETREAGFVDMV